MKRWLALVACIALNALTVQAMLAQQSTPKAHRAITITSGGGYLGVGVAEIDEDRARALKLKDDHGVEVKNLEDESPAAKAGLKEGDVIQEYNGQRVEGVDQFVRMVRETPANRKVTLQIVRDGAPQTLTATILKRTAGAFSSSPFGNGFYFQVPPTPPNPPTPPSDLFAEIMPPDMPHPMLSWESGAIGIEAEALNSQLAEYFGVKDGVLVRSVARNSPAEKAGIKAGDVVMKVNGESVASPREISSQMHTGRNKRAVPFTLMRNHKELSLDVKPADGWQNQQDGHEDL